MADASELDSGVDEDPYAESSGGASPVSSSVSSLCRPEDRAVLLMRERDQLRGASTSWRDLLADLFESVAIWEWQQRQQRWYGARGMAAPWRSVGLRNQRGHDARVAVPLAQGGRALAWQQPQTQFIGP